MIKKLHLFLLLLCSFIGLGSYAQTFPIRITTQLTQPSPIYLSNYADANTINSPIKIQLVLNDLTISNRQVRLKIYFQGNGIAFNTNDFVVGAKPLYLEGGFPLQLTNVDLAPYFEYQNLLGLTPNQYAQPLPEGVYNIYVEVYDFATNRKLSSKTGSTTIIFQNDPPFLNLPLNNASIMQQNIQNIVFGWTPRSINVSNVEYEFSLVEIWDKYTPVQNAFAYSPPLYTTTTRTTSLQYGINQPQLIPGKKYAWRVKAKALLGAEEIGVFKNNGYSEIFSFDYEVFCTAPLAINTEGISENQAKITWTGSIDNFDYQVKYREKNSGSEWYDLVTPRETSTISNLKPNTTYEYSVGSSCDIGKYVHSTIKEFTTLVRDEIAFQGCGIKPDPNDLANKNPLPSLFPNDVIAAGDFPIVVMHATGSNGNFSGDGYVTLPFLEKFRKLIDAADALGGDKINIGQFSRIRITFNNIGLNTDFKLISGEIIASYDPNWSSMANLDPLLNPIIDKIENLFEKLDDLLKRKEEGTITKVEFDKEWLPLVTQAQQEYKDILNDDIPEEFREKVKNFGPILNEVASTTYEAAVPNAREKVAEFKNIQKEYKELLALDAEVLKKLAATVQSLGTDVFIKCTTCKSNTLKSDSNIDGPQKFVIIKQKTKQYLCIIASIKENKINDYVLFDQKSEPNTNNEKFLFFYEDIKAVFSLKDENILALINAQQQVTNCKVIYPFDSKFCETGIITDDIVKNITDELQQCYVKELESITKSLISFTKDSRKNQGLEFAYNGKVYQLNSTSQLVEIEKPLTDEEIRNGNWTDAKVDVKIRFTKNSAGIYQYKAVGFRSNLIIAKIKNNEGIVEQKTADLPKLADSIKAKSNAFFSQNNAFTTPEKTPKQAGLVLNDDKTYADGKQLQIDENARFYKISAEGFGLVTTLLKDGTIEEKTYLDVPKEEAIIKAPGLVTGSAEVVATKVTDLTTLATGIYDLATDKKARDEAYDGLIQIKESIGNEPKTFIPILVEVLSSALSGNTVKEWESLNNPNTDNGKKSHLGTRGVENTVISAIAGTAFVKELPEIAEKVSSKIKKIKNIADEIFNIKTFQDLTEIIPGGKNLTNLGKTEFLTNGYKIKLTKENLKSKLDEIIKFGDNLGEKTEAIVDDIMHENGLTKLDGKYGSNNGYDGIYIKGTLENPTEIIIVESKQFKYVNNKAENLIEHGGVKLGSPSKTTDLPAQMSDDWIDYVANKLTKDSKTKKLGDKLEEVRLSNPDLIKKYVSAVDQTTGELNFLKLKSY